MDNVDIIVRVVDIKTDEMQIEKEHKIDQTVVCVSFFLNRWIKY